MSKLALVNMIFFSNNDILKIVDMILEKFYIFLPGMSGRTKAIGRD